ncbi:MAG: DUF2617 family protein [Nitrospinota bacterium]
MALNSRSAGSLNVSRADDLIFGLSYCEDIPISYKTYLTWEVVGSVAMRAKIIGHSHVVQYSIGNVSLYEVLACTDERDFDGTGFIHFPLKDRNSFKVDESFEEISIAVDIFMEEITNGSSREVSRFLGLKNVVHYKFPGKEDMEFKPITALMCDAEKNSVRTLHVYPEENRLVWTSSRISINDKDSLRR